MDDLSTRRSSWPGEAGSINDPLGVKSSGHSHETDKEDTNTGLVRFAEIAGRSLVNSAVQQPWNGLSQLVNEGTSKVGLGNVLPEMNVVSAAKPATFGSSDWFAETLGTGFGMVAPLMASDGLLSLTGRGLGATRLGGMAAGMAERIPYAESLAPFARPALSGATYGFLFTPTDNSSGNNILVERTKAAGVGAVTFPVAKFGTEAFSAGISKGLLSAGLDAQSNIASKIAVRGASSMLGGAGAGVANAETSSYLNTGHAASLDEVEQSVGAFVVTGGALEGLNAIGAYHGRGREGKVPPEGPVVAPKEQPAAAPENGKGVTETPEKPDSTPSTGGMADVQKRMENANGPRATSPFLVESSIALSKAIADKMNLRGEGDMANNTQWRDFTGLIEQTLAREHADAGTEAGQLNGVLTSATRLLNNDLSADLTAGQRLGLVKQVLYETLHPQSAASDAWGAPVGAIQQTLVGHAPGRVAESVAQLLETGKFQSTLEHPVTVDLGSETLARLPEGVRNTLRPDDHALASLRAAEEPGAPPVVEGQRSYYGQLAQLLALNIHAQGHPEGPFVVAHDGTAKGRPQYFESGTNGDYTSATHGEFSPYMSTAELQRVYDHISGVANESLVIKNGKPTLVTDLSGVLPGRVGDRPGLYVEDTRYLSKLDYLVNGQRPEVWGHDVAKGYAAKFTYFTPEGIKVNRTALVHDGLSDQLQLKNTSDQPRTFQLSVGYGADFNDTFEVRGYKPKDRGQLLAPVVEPEKGAVTLSYDGQDGQRMSTGIKFSGPKPDSLTGNSAEFTISLAPGETKDLEVDVRTRREKAEAGTPPVPIDVERTGAFDDHMQKAEKDFSAWKESAARISTGNEELNSIFNRAWRVLYMLRHPMESGEDAIDAGVPWFAAPFGRDDLITAFQMLPFKPEMARGVLKVMADNQGTEYDPSRAQKPGKIMHELRLGEIARIGELPFDPYYGTVDATPLWLMLIGRYVEATGDKSLLKELKPNIDAALKYLDGEVQGNGYLQYGGESGAFLSNQGWKDSGDSILNSKGEHAKGPITLSEAQGYLYAGWREAAKLAELNGDKVKAAELNGKADALKQRFNKDFWMPDKNFAALALDGQGRQMDVISSNPGHLLFTGLLTPEHAFAVHDRMLQPDMNSGFGFRTLASSEEGYKPFGYHLGSVWPHDVAMALFGMHDLRPGKSADVMMDLADAAESYPNRELPELMGGYPRNLTKNPIPYPVACPDQAWAAGSMFQMLAGNLGVHPNGLNNSLLIFKPTIPDEVGFVRLEGFPVGDKRVDLLFHNEHGQTLVDYHNPQDVRINIVTVGPSMPGT